MECAAFRIGGPARQAEVKDGLEGLIEKKFHVVLVCIY